MHGATPASQNGKVKVLARGEKLSGVPVLSNLIARIKPSVSEDFPLS